MRFIIALIGAAIFGSVYYMLTQSAPITYAPASVDTREAPANTGRNGMTWGVLDVQSTSIGDVTRVSCFGKPAPANSDRCDAYQGDTGCEESRPILCIRKMALPAPADLADMSKIDPNAVWANAEIGLSPSISGSRLTSRADADAQCNLALGSGWHMAEFHDGAQWAMRARGSIKPEMRFWVAISDQPANCWDK